MLEREKIKFSTKYIHLNPGAIATKECADHNYTKWPGYDAVIFHLVEKVTALALKPTVQYHCSAWLPKFLNAASTRRYCPFYSQLFLMDHGQNGFMSNRPCVTQLVDSTHNLGSTYRPTCTTEVHVVYLNFSKAFDSVNRKTFQAYWDVQVWRYRWHTPCLVQQLFGG